MEIGTLYVEEIRATMRGCFALVGAGVILLAVGCVATVGTQDTWLDGYGIIAYFLVPLAFIPLTAVFLANPRANRFVESVTTFLGSHDAQEIRTLCSEISVIARGRLVHTGATREMGGDIDAFEECLGMLTQSERIEPPGSHFRAE
jgi:hypothetical protein